MSITNLPTSYSTLHYDPKLFNAILSPLSITPGSTIKILDNTYTVKRCRLIEFRLYYSSNRLFLNINGKDVKEQSKIKSFLLTTGFTSIKSFTHAFYKQPIILNDAAYVNLWYVCFDNNSYF